MKVKEKDCSFLTAIVFLIVCCKSLIFWGSDPRHCWAVAGTSWQSWSRWSGIKKRMRNRIKSLYSFLSFLLLAAIVGWSPGAIAQFYGQRGRRMFAAGGRIHRPVAGFAYRLVLGFRQRCHLYPTTSFHHLFYAGHVHRYANGNKRRWLQNT